jgi:hypothetical protein
MLTHSTPRDHQGFIQTLTRRVMLTSMVILEQLISNNATQMVVRISSSAFTVSTLSMVKVQWVHTAQATLKWLPRRTQLLMKTTTKS